WIFLVALLGGLVAIIIGAAVTGPTSAAIVFVLFSSFWIIAKRNADRYELRLSKERTGEDIGTFARAFDRRSESFDPWVVRATWEALQPYVSFPLRPTDRLVEDLCIADEE